MSILDQIKTEANSLLQTKQLIRQAIIDQDVAVPESTPFAQYPQLVASIGGGQIIGHLHLTAMAA